MSDDVFIVMGDKTYRVDDDRPIEEVLDEVEGTFPTPHLTVPVHFRPDGMPEVLLGGTLLVDPADRCSEMLVAKIVYRMPWPGKADGTETTGKPPA